ncbi:hypothetical protein F0562_004728 [Nyssa sinensis]|uniref:DEUBAD domain-containing protein n=1 Tax=Nyssa sinensis TaxID=561372 RepID=A0A5J5BZC8_9ASTE|nr:hypothetical protein F0562_004728 [Nyssa sinensis]
MAADQRKKRLNAGSIASSREQCGAKRKKLELSQYRFNEIFELENLTEVLSYEVWQTHLSEYERNLLTQFLPKGADALQVVQELLEGDNFFFGNPFLKWGASLCFGNLHPDAVLRQEQGFKANKKTYYSELQKYHNDMIGKLLMWKERWTSKVPEKEILQKIWRSRKHAEKDISNHANEARIHDTEESLAATSESHSWPADEKACSSDNQNLMMKHGELQRRKGFTEEKYDNSSDGLKVVLRPKRGEKLHSQHIQCSDGAKYMSYIKVSKEQHQHVKSSMKHSSNSIQSRSLNRVLGNLDTFHVQPFEVFEEEERKKLHEYWLKLANRDLPAAFANWRRRQSQKWQLTASLKQEMEENLKSLKEGEGKENTHSMLPEQMDRVADPEPPITIQDEEKDKSDTLLQEQMDNGVANHEPTIALEDEVKKNQNDGMIMEKTDNGVTSHGPTIEDDDESVPVSTQSRHMQQIHSLSGSHEFHPMDLDSEDNHVIARTDDIPPNVTEYPESWSRVDVAVSQGDPLSSTSDVWRAVSMPDPYHHSNSLNHEYTCASELSLGHPQVIQEQPARLIDLESDMHEDNTGKDLLHRQSSDGAFLSPYPSQDRNELLQHFFKGQGVLPYHHEQKQTQTRLDFQPAASILIETGQFSGHFREELNPSLPLEPRQKRLNELYMHQNIRENMYSDGGRYSIPRQEHFSPVNIQDLAVNTARMPVPLQPHLNGGELLSHNWYSDEHPARGGWSGLNGAVGRNNSIGNRNNADQSLFSVLSQCNGLRSSAPYDSMGSTGQFVQSGNYGGVSGGPTPSGVLPQTAHPLDYLSGHEAPASVKSNNIGRMSLPHQNPALQDSMGKPFLRSWNQ